VIARPTGDVKADEVRVTQELLRYIEEFIRRHPEQWHIPHRIWEGSP
jgi:lauroyl/myristoyl acyltransferase